MTEDRGNLVRLFDIDDDFTLDLPDTLSKDNFTGEQIIFVPMNVTWTVTQQKS